MIIFGVSELLCKRSYRIGNSICITEGKVYPVIPYEDVPIGGGAIVTKYDCFWIIDDFGGKCCYYWSDSEETPRSYLKWFFSPDEHRDMKINNLIKSDIT